MFITTFFKEFKQKHLHKTSKNVVNCLPLRTILLLNTFKLRKENENYDVVFTFILCATQKIIFLMNKNYFQIKVLID